MKRVIAKNGRAASIVLAACVGLAGPVSADSPIAAGGADSAASVAIPVAVEVAAEAAATPAARDRLLELVVEYLDLAFVRETRDTRTALLEPQPALAVVPQ